MTRAPLRLIRASSSVILDALIRIRPRDTGQIVPIVDGIRNVKIDG